MVGRVVSVNVSPGGVPKRPIEGAWVGTLGLEDDGHTSPDHGGEIAAVCLYATEAIARVAADGHTAFPGAFGENLTIEGLDWGSLGTGDRLAIGDDGLELELTKDAAPCEKQAQWFVDGAIERISVKRYPDDARWYARVLSEGRIEVGDRVRLGDRVGLAKAGAVVESVAG
jgi:MOSC domain-containing protein YiiM